MPVLSASPTPVDVSARKVKVNPEHVAEARAVAMEQCKTPEEFVKQIVYEGLSAQHVQFATQLPDTWSNLVANNKLHDLIRSHRQLADTSIAFWRRLFPEEVPQVLCLSRRRDVSREKKSFSLTMGIPSPFLMGVSAICVRHWRQFRVRTDLVQCDVDTVQYKLFNFGVNKFICGVNSYNLGVNIYSMV